MVIGIKPIGSKRGDNLGLDLWMALLLFWPWSPRTLRLTQRLSHYPIFGHHLILAQWNSEQFLIAQYPDPFARSFSRGQSWVGPWQWALAYMLQGVVR